MAELVGFQAKTLKFEDGKEVSGFFLYTEEKRDGVTGIACDRTFVSDAKMDGYVPKIGDEIEISYNRWGKAQRVIKT